VAWAAQLLPVLRVCGSNLSFAEKKEFQLMKWFASALVASLSGYYLAVFIHGNNQPRKDLQVSSYNLNLYLNPSNWQQAQLIWAIAAAKQSKMCVSPWYIGN
jgi:hypothetical protein